jgi:hypothetical protein
MLRRGECLGVGGMVSKVVVRMRQVIDRLVLSQGSTHLLPAVIGQGIEHLRIAANEGWPTLDEIFLRQGSIAKANVTRLQEPQSRASPQEALHGTLGEPQSTSDRGQGLGAMGKIGEEVKLQGDVQRTRRHKA